MDPTRNFADVKATGAVTLDEALRMIRVVAAELAHNQCGSLVDVREMNYYPTVVELKEIAFEYIRLRNAFRCGIAFIVSNDKHYGLGRLLAALVDSAGLRIGVFRDSAEAEGWLKNLADVHFSKGSP
jgi:hypothetical protein